MGSPHDIVAKVLDYYTVLSMCVLQSHYRIHVWKT